MDIMAWFLISGCVSGKVGITLDAFWADPKDANKPEDIEAAENYLQMHVSYEQNSI